MSLRPLLPSLLLALVACTGEAPKDTASTDDTGPVDTSGTTGDDTGPTDTVDEDRVRVTVYDALTGGPDANEAVLFFGPDGAFLVEVATDAAGTAVAALPDGGAVVVMVHNDEDALPYWPVASLGVQPGAELSYRSLPPLAADGADLSWPAEEEAESYRYAAACGETAAVYGFTYDTSASASVPRCADAVALVAAMGPDAVVGVAGVAADSNSAVAIPGPWVVPGAVELAATGLDPATETVSVDAWHAMGAARVPGTAYGTGTPSAGRFQVSGALAQMDGLSYQLWVTQSRTGFVDATSFVRRPASTDLSVDVSGVTLAWTTTPALDPATGTVSWSQEGTGDVDAVLAVPYLRRGADTFGWTVGVAPDGPSIVLPVLPEPWSDYNPRAGDEVAGEYWVYRGEGLADAAVEDPSALLDRGYMSRGVEILTDYSLAFSRTFLP